MNSTIIKMSNAYETMEIEKEMCDAIVIDCRDISGTKCYLDELALCEIQSKIDRVDVEGIHFIDSGNYHYLSLLMLQKIDKPFSLILVDKHPDIQMPLFGDIISCGGWLLKAIECVKNLQTVYMYGVDEHLIEEVSPLPDNVVILKDEKSFSKVEELNYPIYMSIDKDALSRDYSVTDWDQGTMSLEQLFSFFKVVLDKRELIGIDICGDTSEPTTDSDKINSSTNKALIDFFGDFI